MGEIINLREHMPHMQGEAVCMNCQHKWQAASSIGVVTLECPVCDTMQGVYTNYCHPENKSHWECQCGNIFFVLTEGYFHCAHCGLAQEF